jgi:drug/metabolite transporter (DMT)-like permease
MARRVIAPLGAVSRRPHALAILAMLGWGVAYVPSAWLLDRWPALPGAGARLGLAGLLLLALAAVTGRRVLPGVPFRTVLWLGFTQTTIFYGATFLGIANESAGLAAVLSNTDPLFVAALGAIFLAERLSYRQWAGLAVGLGGAALAVSPEGVWPFEVSPTAVFVVFGALGWAVGTIVATRSVRGDSSPLALAGWQMVLGAALLFVWGAALGEYPGGLEADTVGLIVGVAVLGSALPLALFYRALLSAPAGEVSAWFFLVPVVGVSLSWPLLGEQPSPTLAAGVVAVSVGLWLVMAARRSGGAR